MSQANSPRDPFLGRVLRTPTVGGGTPSRISGFSLSLQPVIFLPNLLSTDFSIPSPAASPPPAYDNVAPRSHGVEASPRLEASFPPVGPASPSPHPHYCGARVKPSPRTSPHISLGGFLPKRANGCQGTFPFPFWECPHVLLCISLCSTGGSRGLIGRQVQWLPSSLGKTIKLSSPESSRKEY